MGEAMMRKICINTVLIVLLVFLNLGSALAKDFESRIDLNKKSVSVGIDRDSIELVHRLPGPGRDVVIQKLVKRFESESSVISTTGKSKRLDRKESSSILGDGWRIKVWGSGSKFSYFDQEYTRQPQYKAVRLEERFTNTALEKMARNFIKQHLGGLIELGPGEEIVPLFTEFEIAGGESANGEMEEETVISSIIQFGRRIDGIDVVGSGSQIALYFGNDGVPFGFDVDWPKYERTGVFQKTIPVDQIFKRLPEFGPKIRDVDEEEIRRFECGYFDAGERNYDPNSHIQAGCVAHKVYIKYDKKTGDKKIAPIVHDIPAGAQVIFDKNWPEKGQNKREKGLIEGFKDK
jgi:hypothetical protein